MDYDTYQQLAERTMPTEDFMLTSDEEYMLTRCFDMQIALTALIQDQDLYEMSLVDLRHWLVMGLVGEVGEFIDLLKKFIFHKQSIERERFIDEAGDVYWYLATTSHVCGHSMSSLRGPLGKTAHSLADILRAMTTILRILHIEELEVVEGNVTKLRTRYPNNFELGGGTDR